MNRMSGLMFDAVFLVTVVATFVFPLAVAGMSRSDPNAWYSMSSMEIYYVQYKGPENLMGELRCIQNLF